MALLGKIIKLKNEQINLRPGKVVCDVIFDKNYLQIRSYRMGDINCELGSKQNIQFDKNTAKEIRDLLNEFINS